MIDYSEQGMDQRMGEIENLGVVRRIFAFVQSRGETGNFAERWAAYSDLYDPDVTIHEAPSLPYGGDYASPDALAKHAQGFQAAWDGLQPEGERSMEPRFFANGDEVAVLWRLRAKREDGASLDMPAMSLYRLKDRKVVESRMFTFDAAAVSAFLSSAGD